MLRITKENGYAIDLGAFDVWKCPLREEDLAFMRQAPKKFIKMKEDLGACIHLKNPRSREFYKRPSATVTISDMLFLQAYSEEKGGLTCEEMLLQGLRGDYLLSTEVCKALYTLVFWGYGDETL